MPEFVRKILGEFQVKRKLKKKKGRKQQTKPKINASLVAVSHHAGRPRGCEVVPRAKGLQLKPLQAGGGCKPPAEPGSPAAATDGLGQPPGRDPPLRQDTVRGEATEGPEEGSGAGGGAGAARGAAAEPVPLPGPGEAALPPHPGRWEEVWAASRVPKAGARRGCGPHRQRAGCFPSPPA